MIILRSTPIILFINHASDISLNFPRFQLVDSIGRNRRATNDADASVADWEKGWTKWNK